MNIEEELKKQQIVQEIRKFVMGATIEPNMQETKRDLIKRCNEVGINFEELEERCKNEIPQKRTYSELIRDTQIDGIERGLSVAFETLLKGERLDTRRLDDKNGKQLYSNGGFSQEHRNMCRMDVLRSLCISLKNDTIGYNLNNTDLRKFLKERGINSNLKITKEQLDYIHSIDLDSLEDFLKSVNITDLNSLDESLKSANIPQQLVESTKIWEVIDKKGDSKDYLYEVNEENAYRIYINSHQKSDKTDTFLTDYIKMCISRKMPFTMKGSQDKDENSKDNTVLYLSEENLQDYLQILDELSIIHPDIVTSFGEPPLLTQTLSNKVQNALEGWFGFSDLGNDTGVTYNDRTQCSCASAFIATIYESLPYKAKEKIQENGYSTKELSSIAKLELDYEQLPTTIPKRVVTFHKVTGSRKPINTPLQSDGQLRWGENLKFASELVSLCSDELAEILKNPQKKQKMFEKFRQNYVLMENYFKYNSRHNKHSMEYSFEDYRELPTTISMSLYQKYQQELHNGESKHEIEERKEKSFLQVFQEAFRDDTLLKSGVEATTNVIRTEQINQQINQIKEQYRSKEEKQTQLE